MEELLKSIHLRVNEKIYLSDPTSSDLGKRILKHGSKIICQEGLDSFNFKKLSKEISSTEAAIYRYFENKNKLLLFYFSWYWKWIEYNMVFRTQNLATPEERMQVVLEILTNPPQVKNYFEYIDGAHVFELMGKDGIRVLLSAPQTDDEKDMVRSFRSVCERFAQVIEGCDKGYKYPVQLAATILITSHMNKTLLPTVLDNMKDNELVDFWMYSSTLLFDSKGDKS